MSVENSEEGGNNGRHFPFVDDKNANKVTCSNTRPSRVNYATRTQEHVDLYGRTREHDANVHFRNESDTDGIIQYPYIGLELEDTVDYSCKEALVFEVGSTCAISSATQILAHSSSQSFKEPTSLQGSNGDLTRMPSQSHNEAGSYIKNCNDQGFDKHIFYTSFELTTVDIEAPDSTLLDVDGAVVQTPIVSNDGLEQMLVVNENSPLSFLTFPSVYYDEMCMRKNSFVSSSAEKPQSASALESSAVPNASSDVGPEIKLSNDMPDICKGTSDFCHKELDYIDLPSLNGESKKELQNLRPFTKQDGDSEQSHYFVPHHNADQQTTCGKPREQTHATEDADKERFDCHTKSKYTVSDPVQVDTPKPRNTSSGHYYEDTFFLDSPSGAGTCTSTPIPDSKNMTFFIPGLEDLPEKVKLVQNDSELGKDERKGTPAQIVRAGDGSNAAKAKRPLLTATNKFKKLDVITFPKPNFKNVKPKVMTRTGVQLKDGVAAKISPRSPQSGSTASSPVASPRTPCASTRFGKKGTLEQDLKPEPMTAKSHQQPINKQLFAAAYSKNVLSKVPKTISALKQSRGDADKASSSNSACSSASAAATTCIQSWKVTDNKMERPKTLPKPNILTLNQMLPGQNECNGILEPHLETQELMKASACNDPSEVGTTKVPISTKLIAASAKIVQKDYPTAIKSTAVPKAASIVKPKLAPTAAVRRETATKSIVTNGLSSPRRTSQPVSNGLESSGPGGKSSAVQSLALVTGRSLPRPLPRSRLPCKESLPRRTPSVSSVCSSQSEQSTCSNRSTAATSSLKNESPSTSIHPQKCSGPPAAKALVSKSRVQPLKAAQTGTKPKPGLICQVTPKPTARKIPEAKPLYQIGVAGVFGARYSSVEKSKQKASPKTPCTPAQSSPDERKALEFAQCRAKCERQSGFIGQLKQLIVSSNQRFEAVTVVVQQLMKQREEALKQRRALSQELVSLRGDLVTSSVTCEKLEKEKNELQVAYEGILEKLKAQHTSELEDLEEKLKEFYTGECQKLQCVFFEEAEKYKTELQGKVDELTASHEAFRLELETKHSEKIKQIQDKYEQSFSELKDKQEQEKSTLEESFTEKQSSLEKSIDELKSENDSLREKLKSEEEQRKIAKEKSNQKNPRIMYLEQELESLKVVMEIKNEKLHKQDKKLMQVEKLVDNNTTLFEKLKKCQQENEDLKARMDKHMALSRQLSTEQAVLQESLEKESKVNKRLSMENEELLWKLHNGDLCSPKKLSPTSPSIPFQSSRSSGSFSSPTVSPR